MYLNINQYIPASQIEKLTFALAPTDQNALHQLVTLFNLVYRVYPSQKWLSEKSGVSLNTMHRNLKRLHDWGLITKIYRGKKKTCLYILHEHLRTNLELRKKLSKIIPAFRWHSRELILALKEKRDKWKQNLGVQINKYIYKKEEGRKFYKVKQKSEQELAREKAEIDRKRQKMLQHSQQWHEKEEEHRKKVLHESLESRLKSRTRMKELSASNPAFAMFARILEGSNPFKDE